MPNSFVENVNKVASLIPSNVEDLNLIVQNIDSINAVAPIVNYLNDIIDNIVPNLTEILDADDNATIATTQATIATEQAINALASATIASAYANLEWGGFNTLDGELIVSYADGATSLPSLVDGDFIITY